MFRTMPVLAALWVALLHLLAAPAPRTAGVAAPARRVEWSVETAPALRAPRPLPALGAVRSDAPRQTGPAPHGLAPAPWPRAAIRAVAARRAARQPSHASSARGGLLPYFPTAPPPEG
jgi:hypothetical protein